MTGLTEHPDDSDRPTSLSAPELGAYGGIEVEPYYGPGKVALSFISLGHVTCLELGVETLDRLIAALQDACSTAAEFANSEEGVLVDTKDTQSGPVSLEAVSVHPSPQQTLRGAEVPVGGNLTPATPAVCPECTRLTIAMAGFKSANKAVIDNLLIDNQKLAVKNCELNIALAKESAERDDFAEELMQCHETLDQAEQLIDQQRQLLAEVAGYPSLRWYWVLAGVLMAAMIFSIGFNLGGGVK